MSAVSEAAREYEHALSEFEDCPFDCPADLLCECREVLERATVKLESERGKLVNGY